jgi:phosphoribosylaminoimidazolecarboxamide formyltransferase / IMP cyclohydrolase
MADKIKLARALLGVSDKTALVELAQALVRHGVEIIATGGTRTALEAAAVRVIAVASKDSRRDSGAARRSRRSAPDG